LMWQGKYVALKQCTACFGLAPPSKSGFFILARALQALVCVIEVFRILCLVYVLLVISCMLCWAAFNLRAGWFPPSHEAAFLPREG